jgi:hypothetical protein
VHVPVQNPLLILQDSLQVSPLPIKQILTTWRKKIMVRLPQLVLQEVWLLQQ